MPRFTSFGIQPVSHQEYYDDLSEILRKAFGDDVNLTVETPQGQLIELLSRYLADLDLFGVETIANLDFNQASEWMLDRYGSLIDLPRREGTYTQIEAIFRGTPFFLITEGLRLSAENGRTVVLTKRLRLDKDGIGIGILNSTTSGAIDIPSGSWELEKMVPFLRDITEIVSPRSSVMGRDRETDADYRRRYLQTIQQHIYGTSGGLEAALRLLPGVSYASVIENLSHSPLEIDENITIPTGGFVVIVGGGNGSEITQLISNFRSIGTPIAIGGATYRTERGYILGYYPVERIAIEVEIDIEPTLDFPVDGLEALHQHITDWFEGDDTHHWDGIGVGEPIDEERFRAALYLVPNHQVKSIKFTLQSQSVEFYAPLQHGGHTHFRHPVQADILVPIQGSLSLPFKEVYDCIEEPSIVGYPDLDPNSSSFGRISFLYKQNDGLGLQVKENFVGKILEPPELFFVWEGADSQSRSYIPSYLAESKPVPDKIPVYKRLFLHPSSVKINVDITQS